jgi:hypothetical protein
MYLGPVEHFFHHKRVVPTFIFLCADATVQCAETLISYFFAHENKKKNTLKSRIVA